ncbi:hypothetical protein JOD52_002332 [Brachybacterium muris]|uniref:hypothetical protein n=1 Tax=Brachybacterium muris TaxID=219301 RepID=UPI0019560CCB|nr:hypothetical protein [Brachybacterium muris]MBM7501492.1 hypothetical protein [Brachybacterium muris]
MTTFGRLFVRYHHDPSDEVAQEIMVRLRAVDLADLPADAVVIRRTLSNIDPMGCSGSASAPWC